MDVLPAPFGPMMARISPLRISNETPVIAFTPPKESDTFSMESSSSSVTASCALGALMIEARARSGCFPHAGSGRGMRRKLAYLDARGQGTLAPVLEGDLGRDVGLVRSLIKRGHQRRIALGDKAAPHLLG